MITDDNDHDGDGSSVSVSDEHGGYSVSHGTGTTRDSNSSNRNSSRGGTSDEASTINKAHLARLETTQFKSILRKHESEHKVSTHTIEKLQADNDRMKAYIRSLDHDREATQFMHEFKMQDLVDSYEEELARQAEEILQLTGEVKRLSRLIRDSVYSTDS